MTIRIIWLPKKKLIQKAIQYIKELHKRVGDMEANIQNKKILIGEQQRSIAASLQRERQQEDEINAIHEENIHLNQRILQLTLDAQIYSEKLDVIERIADFQKLKRTK